MNTQQNQKLIVFEGIDQFLKDHPLVPPNAKVTALTALNATHIAAMHAQSGGQDTGQAELRGGVTERLMTDASLRKLMRKVARVAKVLDPEEFPGLARQLRLPRDTGFQHLQDRALTFIELVTPAATKTAFTDRGLPTDFDEQLQTLLDEFVTASSHKYSGLQDQMRGTGDLIATARAGMKTVRELDAILSQRYEDDYGLFSAWKGAIRLPKRKKKETEPAAAPAGSGPAPGPVGLAM